MIDQWPALFAYFDSEVHACSNNYRVQRITKQLSDPTAKLIGHFVSYVLKPLNIALRTNTSRIGSQQSDVCTLLRAYLSNFIKPDILAEAEDITKIEYHLRTYQVDDDELGIGTSTSCYYLGSWRMMSLAL